jgi:hypothetical protein
VWALQFAEKLAAECPQGLKPSEKKGFIAALKALRHPKSSFPANCLNLVG